MFITCVIKSTTTPILRNIVSGVNERARLSVFSNLFYNEFMKNPFKYSLDNKRYLTWNYYGKSNFQNKIIKIPLDGPFSCPNRDGLIGKGGCVFCFAGSNAFPKLSDNDLMKQYYQRKEIFLKKWPNGIPYAYFQSFSNTYGSLEKLKEVYQPFIDNKEIKGIVISTRSDCLNDEKIDYLNSLTSIKPLWIELGLQSIHDKTLKEMNRGHSYQNFLDAIEKLKNTNIKISVHLINGWPTESEEMMLQTAKEVGKLPIHAIKFHMLHISKNTVLGNKYQKKPFELLSKEQYVTIVAKQLSYLREDIIIERLTGDGLKEYLLAPMWTLKKVSVINDIDKKMVELDLYQGKYYSESR